MICTLPMMMNWWKKQIDFVKINFHSNGNIEWCCMHFELNCDLIEVDSIFLTEFKYIDWNLNWISNQLDSIQQLD